MKILPNTGLLAPTTNDKEKEGIDGLETARYLIETSFQKVDGILGGMNRTALQEVTFDNTTRHGDVVYLREDGVFAPALSEYSVRKNVAGIADTVQKRVLLVGIVEYEQDSSGFKRGDYLYLSPRFQGELQTNSPENAPEILVGYYLGNRLYSINITTAISEYLQKGIPDGSIGTEKLKSNTIAPYAREVVFGSESEGIPNASELGQIGLVCKEYTGDLNEIVWNSKFQIESGKVENSPADFDKGTFGVIDTYIIKDNMCCQILWSVNDTDNQVWTRKKYDNAWTLWASLTSNNENQVGREIFYNTLLLGSQYKYCFYDVLENCEHIGMGTIPPIYDGINQKLVFSSANQSIYCPVVTGADNIQGFRVVIPEVDEDNYTLTYSVNGRAYKETKNNTDNFDTFTILTIRITAKSGFSLGSFGVLYGLESKFHTDSDMILLKDYTTNKAYRLSVESGILTLQPMS